MTSMGRSSIVTILYVRYVLKITYQNHLKLCTLDIENQTE